jgi:hypothetical protein
MEKLNKHLVNIVREYLETTQPFLKHLKSTTSRIFYQTSNYKYYGMYNINQYDFRNLKYFNNPNLKVRYNKYNGWIISS